MLNKLKIILFFEKNLFNFLFLLVFSLLLALMEMLALVSLASLGSTLSGSGTFFFKVFGFSQLVSLSNLLIFIILIFLVKNLLLVFYNLIRSSFISNFSKKVSKILFNDLLRNSYVSNVKKKPADIIRKINEDVHPAVEYVFALLDILKEFFILISIVILIFITTEKTQMVIFFFYGILVYFLYLIVKKLLITITRKYIISRTKIITLLYRTFGSLKENFVYQNNKHLIIEFSHSIKNIAKFYFYQSFITQMPKIIFETFVVIGLIIFAAILSLKGMNNTDVLNKIIIISVVSIRLIPVFNSISSVLTTLRIHKEIFENIAVDLQRALKNKGNVIVGEKLTEINFDKSISFKKINLKYTSGKKKIINDSNFTIHKNKIIGITGASGSGKTTIVDYIIGLANIQVGKSWVNNEAISSQFTYKKNLIGYVPQFPFLLDDTIKNNIIFGRKDQNINNKSISKVIKITKLDTLVKNLKNKENTQVGNQGAFLSGGQKQRIILARSLLLNPKILILDEATNALDSDTESKIINDILKMKNKITIIIISHNKQIIKKCDIAYKIFNNKIIQSK